MAHRSLKKLARLADRLNMIAQLERAKLELACSPSDMVEVARTAMKQALAVDARSAVTVRTELPDTPCLVLGDPRWLVPAFAEMVGNAVRHAHRNACVRVECDDDDVCLIVEDDGGGIAPEARETMFRRLIPRQNDRSLGLGLSIVHDVVAAHGGSLEIDAPELVHGGPRTALTRFTARLARHEVATAAGR
jgi:signal transduction histidine kinase